MIVTLKMHQFFQKIMNKMQFVMQKKSKKSLKKKKAQLDGHVENLNALKKEIEVTAIDKLNKTFTEDAAEYAKKAVNQMLAD